MKRDLEIYTLQYIKKISNISLPPPPPPLRLGKGMVIGTSPVRVSLCLCLF